MVDTFHRIPCKNKPCKKNTVYYRKMGDRFHCIKITPGCQKIKHIIVYYINILLKKEHKFKKSYLNLFTVTVRQ